MLSWPDALCETLARGGRHVVRYDLRDCGASTTLDPEAPAYTLRDLAADAAALARELDSRASGGVSCTAVAVGERFNRYGTGQTGIEWRITFGNQQHRLCLSQGEASID